ADRRGVRRRRRDRREGPQAVRRAGAGGRCAAQAPGASQPAAEARRRGRGEADRPGLLGPARGPGVLDDAIAGRPGRRTGGRRLHRRGDRPHRPEKTALKPWLREQWVIPPKADAAFVAAMEDVLEVYHRPYDEKRPTVCLDEASKQLIGEVAESIPAAPGRPERVDYEYVRNGTANLFMASEPLRGWRAVKVT